MFQKTTFGANTSGYGTFSANAATSSPFGFKPATATSAFGATPAFGASPATQPTATGGLFGATSNTTGGGLFGNTAATPAPAFGASTSTFGGFGATPSTGGGLFSTNTTGGGLFGNTQNTSAFGAKPAGGFGFGATTVNNTSGGGLFGGTATTGGLFGQQTNNMSGGGLFSTSATGAFGQQPAATGTGHVKYNPVTGTDVIVKNGTSQNVNIKHLCITCMKEYENKCLEELRLEDYIAGRKGPSQAAFGSLTQTENKPLFGAGGFGQTPTTSAQNVFGAGGLGTSTFGQTNTFSFGGNTQPNTQSTGLFGGAKPAFGAASTAGTGLFGTTTTTQAAPAFGANTSTFGGFGATTNQQTGGLFGAKPATTGAATTGFGGFGSTGGLFGAKPATATAAPAFGTTQLGGFGTNTATTGGIFGGGTFGKPNTSQPTFGLTQTPALGSGLGANTLQAKPTGFGTLGGGTMFQQPQNNNAFNTGLNTGLGGGGLFSNTSTLGGGMGGLGGMNTNTGMLNGPGSLSGSAAVHEQILAVAARPYAGSNLFKDLLPETSNTTDDALLATNPAAMKAALDKSQYKLTSPAQTMKLKPRQRHDKKSLFDGLEEADASLEDKLSLKPSRKRLVLRPNNTYNRENSEPVSDNRSLEERRENSFPSMPEREKDTSPSVPDKDRHIGNSEKEERRPFAENNHFDSISDRHGSWLSSPPQMMWKEKHAEIEPTPRIYPQLDKELPIQISERRASWLTTKPLRKPTLPGVDSENSVRELINHEAHREQDMQRSRERSLDASPDRLSLSEEEHAPPSKPHPAGIKLNRPGYYTIPSLEDCINYIRPDGRCVVPNFTIGRKNYGNVYFDCEMDITGLDLDALVHFLNKEVIIYPEDADKPPIGEGLNRRAIVTLDRIWPRDKTDRCTITSPERLLKMDYEGKLRRVCDKHDTKFIEYRPQTGSWVFRVEHFSKYGLTDSDEEDDITPEVMKRQLEHQQLQKAAPIPSLPVNMKSPGLGGLSFIDQPRTVPGVDSIPAVAGMEEAMFASSLNIMNGSGKVSAYDMDTTENAELQSMYTDMERAFAVKSPTSELARLEHRHTHNVQLMKASLYADTEMEEDASSVSTSDQRVPTRPPAPHSPPSPPRYSPGLVLVPDQYATIQHEHDEIPLKPLILRPQTVVLQYHRKVPPFKQTIAGGLEARYIADLQVCRSRHSRVGFAPGSSLAYVTSYDAVAELPKSADLCDIGEYLSGRSENDWSGLVVNNIKINNPELRQSTVKHIKALLEHSKSTPREHSSPLYSVDDRLGLLKRHVEISKEATAVPKFGVSSSYCHEVWKLCDALWGADLENGGIPGTDNQSIVHSYRQFLSWINSAVADITDKELAEAKTAELEDDGDFHSSRIFTLLLGGRVVEACKLAAEHGDLNMCALIAQGAGDPSFRSLLSRQLATWRECGATTLISSYRVASLQLLAGIPPKCLAEKEWMAALSATARYLCPQIPSLEQIVRKYESLFHAQEGESETDITTIEDAAMNFPSPPHLKDYDVEVTGEKKARKVVDLRYELIRGRAYNTRPKLHPHSYTPDPLDYSLCFLVGSWLGSASDEACSSFSSQLEANGDWDLAVVVLCFMNDDALRAHLIRNVLSRHAPSSPQTDEQKQQLLLVESLQLPEEWIWTARADRAKYEHQPLLQAQHLVAAQQWGAAHRVLVDELMTDHVLNNKLESLAPILEKLNEAAGRSLVAGWEAGGKALYHYSIICREIQGVVNEAESSSSQADVAAKLQSLRPHVVAACNSLTHYKPSSAVWAATLSAMAAALSRVSHSNTLLLRAPPDTRYNTISYMVSELCERASEMCVETNNEASPVRS